MISGKLTYRYDIFISYKWNQYRDSVYQMVNEFEKVNLKVWLDRREIKEAEDLSMKMKKGIDESKLFLCCVTDDYCDFENYRNKNCKSEFNYAFTTNKKILYVIFQDIKGLKEDQIVKRFNAVGFRMAGNLFYMYNSFNLKDILEAIKIKLKEEFKTPLSSFLPIQSNDSVKRKKLEESIKKSLEDHKLVVLKGVSGIGKTNVAISVGYEFQDIKAVRFIYSEKKESINVSLREILNCLVRTQQNVNELNDEELVKNILSYLDKYKTEYLFILDNLKCFDDIKTLVDQSPQHAKFLITTQNQSIDLVDENAEIINIDSFHANETKEYIIRNLKTNEKTKEIATKLTDAISNSKEITPLELAHIITYLNKSEEISLKDFLNEFKNIEFDFIEDNLRRVKYENSELWSLLEFASAVEGSFIHNQLLSIYLNIDTDDTETLNILIESAKQCLLVTDVYNQENEYGISISALIQKKVLDIEELSNEKINKIANTIRIYFKNTEYYPDESWKISRHTLGHAKKLLKNNILTNKELRVSLLRKIALSHINQKYKIEEGIKYCEKALDIQEKYFDKEGLISLAVILGDGYESIGKYDKSYYYYNISEIICREIFDESHSSLGEIYNKIGVVHEKTGKFKEAAEYYYKSLNVNHPYFFDTLNNLGKVYHCMKKYKESLDHFNESLKIKFSKYEAYHQANNHLHPSIGDTYNNIGIVHQSMCEYQKALDFYKLSLDIGLQAYSNDHPSIGLSYNNLGSVYHLMGENERALEYYKISLDIKLNAYYIDHPTIAETHNNIGLVYESLKKYEKSIECYKKSLDIKLKIYGEDHPSIATTYNNIGIAYDLLGKYQQAISYHEKSINIKLKFYDHDHLSIASSYKNIAIVYDSMKESEIAIGYFLKALDLFNKNFGPDHPDCVSLREHLEFITQRLSN